MISMIKGKGFRTFLLICSLFFILMIFHTSKENSLLQENYQIVDEEYVPNTLVPYSKNCKYRCKTESESYIHQYFLKSDTALLKMELKLILWNCSMSSLPNNFLQAVHTNSFLEHLEETYDHRSCKGLFATGTLIQPCKNDTYSKLNSCARNIAEQWKPDGCKLKYYTNKMMTTCFSAFSKSGRKTLYLIGDSIVREVFNSFYRKYTGKLQPTEKFETTSMYIKEADVTIKYSKKMYLNDEFRNELTKILNDEERPIFMHFANNLHYIQTDRGKNPFKTFEDYEKILTDLVPTMNRMSQITKTVWPLGATVHKDGQIISWLVPYRVQLVDLYNDVANKILKPSDVTLIYSFRSLGKATFNSYLDPTHMGSLANDIIVQILLNYICNNQWQETDVQENVEDICCSKQDKLT